MSIEKLLERLKLNICCYIYAAILSAANFIRIFNNNFWGDEGYSIRLTRMSMIGMIKETASDVHPPLYYIILKLVYAICGDHGWTFRLASLIPSILMLVFCITIIRKRWGDLSAILMMTFISFMPPAVTYNLEARMYSWAALFVLLSYYAFLLIIEGESQYRYIIFVATSLGAAYCHYYALVAVGILYIGLIHLLIKHKLTGKSLLLIYGITIIAYLPWAWQLFTTIKRTADDFWLTTIPSLYECITYIYNDRDTIYGLVLMFLTVIAVINYARHTNIDWFVWGIIMFAATAGIGIGISIIIRPMFILRYLYPIAPVLWLITTVSLTKMPKPIELTLSIIVVSIMICGLGFARTVRSEYRDNSNCINTVSMIDEAADNGYIVLTNNNHLAWTLMDYYLPDLAYEYTNLANYSFQMGENYYLVWDSELTDEEINDLSEIGLDAEIENNQALIGNNKLCLIMLK